MTTPTSPGPGTGEERRAAEITVTAGHPTPEELATLVVALDTLRRAEADPLARTRPATPAWQRAAHLEGVGGTPITSPADLRGN